MRTPLIEGIGLSGPAVPAKSGAAYVVYFLYIAAIFLVWPMLVGVIVAYACRGASPAWLETHYRYQIRTFWLMLFFWLLVPIAAVLFFPLTFLFVLLGFHLWVGFAIWIGLRCLVGLRELGELRPIDRPATWLA